MQIQQCQRLRIARKALGLTLREFAEPLDVSYQTVHKWESGRASISRMAAQVIEKQHKISIEWLLDGKGDMFVNMGEWMKRQAATIQDPYVERHFTISGVPMSQKIYYATVPLVKLRIDGGQLSISVAEPLDFNPVLFSNHWLFMRIGVKPDNLVLIEIDGDNVAPDFKPCDLVMIDKTAPSLPFRAGLWVFNTASTVHIERLEQVDSALSTALIGKVVWSDRRW